MQANLIEMMSSVQGEGLVVGLRQVFIRFAGCNLACAYCDTKDSLRAPDFWRIETSPGSGCWQMMPNPVDVYHLISKLELFDPAVHHSLSLTGGEPLLHSEFLVKFLPEAKRMGWRIYLETNGTLIHELRKVIDLIDIVAMDIKLESATGMTADWHTHREFLKSSIKKDTFIKVVVNRYTLDRELENLTQIAPELTYSTELVLQPQTGAELPLATQWLKWQEKLKPFYREVRIIPQTHKILGVL